MKATKNTILRTAVFIAILILSPMLSSAQTGKVWTRITDINALAISVNMDKEIVSQNQEVNAMIQNLHITGVEKAFPASHSRELMNVYEITCNCDENDLLQILASKSTMFQNPEIAANPEVLFTPNDYSLVFSNDYALNLINAQGAWDITQGDSSIVIAITDANFHLTHEELAGKYNYVSPNSSSDYVHGTAVAITAAGNSNNYAGKSSIGFNSSLELRTMSFNQVLEASYAGARIVNMSWSSGCYFNSYSQLIIDEAHANGTILVASAGNGGTCNGANNLVYPAAYNHVIAVSSVGPFDNHERTIGNPTTTHQHNSSVDICAPGYDVALSIAPGNYLTGNGTSFAAPFVSGTIALMLAVNPCLTAEQVEYILKQTAVNIDELNPAYAGKLGAGRLDAQAAVEMASKFTTMAAALTGENTVLCATMEQGITLDMSTVTSPYHIDWNMGANTPSISNLNPGTYSAVVRDSAGCVAYFETVIDTVVPMTISADIFPIQCFGQNSGSIEIFAAGAFSNYTYEWNTGDTTANLYNVYAGTYSVTITDGRGCSKNEEFILNQPSKLIGDITHVNPGFNQSGNIDLSVNGGTAPYIFSWNQGASTEDLAGISAGFYEVLITDSKGCLASANVIVTDLNYEELNNGVSDFTDDFVRTEKFHNTSLEIDNKQSEDLAPTTSSNSNSTMTMIVYPNPASENTSVSWSDKQVVKVILLDMTGKVIQVIEVQPYMNSLLIQSVSQGEYLVKLVTVDGEQAVQKVRFL